MIGFKSYDIDLTKAFFLRIDSVNASIIYSYFIIERFFLIRISFKLRIKDNQNKILQKLQKPLNRKSRWLNNFYFQHHQNHRMELQLKYKHIFHLQTSTIMVNLKMNFFLELFRAKFLRGLSMTRGPNDHRKDASPFRLRAVTEDDRVKMGFY